MAICVAKDNRRPTGEELIAFCRERLGGYKVPRHFEFIDQLPRNASGKVLKRELRKPYWTDSDRAIA